VLCDNESFLEHDTSIKAYRKPRILLLHIPPKSPDLNPVEKFWGWVRKRLHKMDHKVLPVSGDVTPNFHSPVGKDVSVPDFVLMQGGRVEKRSFLHESGLACVAFGELWSKFENAHQCWERLNGVRFLVHPSAVCSFPRPHCFNIGGPIQLYSHHLVLQLLFAFVVQFPQYAYTLPNGHKLFPQGRGKK